MKKLILILLLALGSTNVFSQIVPQWKPVTGGLMSYFYTGKTPNGFDTLWNAKTIRIQIASAYTNGTGILLSSKTFSLDVNYTNSLYAQLSGTYSNPSWISSLAYSKLTGAPVNISAFTNDANYVNTAGARSALSATGSLSYNPSTGVFNYTQPTNVSSFTNDANYTTVAGARSGISATGNVSYNPTTGVINYVQPTIISTFTNDVGYIRALDTAAMLSPLFHLNGTQTANGNYTFAKSVAFNGQVQTNTVRFLNGNLVFASTASAIYGTWFNSTSNFLIQNAGTQTDLGYKLAINSSGTNGVLFLAIGKIAITEGTNGRVGQVTLTGGVGTITITGLTTTSRAFAQFAILGGTVTTTWQYRAVCTANTLTITALTNAGTTNTSDTSVINYMIIN